MGQRSSTPRYESQLAASEKQYGLLQRQYDAGLASSEQLADASSALRRERDALWAQAESLRAEVRRVGLWALPT